jgi:membrane peptidoglycan carboxypeptidase
MGRRILHDDKEHEWLTFREIVELSSNIGIAKWALTISGEELFNTYEKFGFGQRLGCGMPGETGGRLARPPRWSDYNIAALAMGHSVATSPLQLAAAFGAIANGGRVIRPRLILGYVADDGRVEQACKPEVLSQAFLESSADSLRAFLRGVVEHGTAEPVNSQIVSIAGKTGTAEIPDLVNGGYHKHRFNASFAGFFPAEEPVVAGIVVIEDPRPITYGGYTAGPTFRRIAECYTVLNPDAFVTASQLMEANGGRLENTVEAPDLMGRDINLAREMAAKRGLTVVSTATDGKVVWQFPASDRLMFSGDELLVEVESFGDTALCMPDLRGLPLRTAVAYLHHAGIKYRAEGSGRVTRQSPLPGAQLTKGNSECRLKCRPT